MNMLKCSDIISRNSRCLFWSLVHQQQKIISIDKNQLINDNQFLE